MPAVTVLSSALPVATIDAFLDLQWTRPYWVAGKFTLKVASAMAGAAELTKGRTILPPDSNIVYLIEQVLREDDGSGNDILTVSGRDLGGFFQERICLPTTGQAYDSQTSAKAETAMKHYVSLNAGSGAASQRQVPGLTIAADAARGGTITYQARYDLLSDVLQQIGQTGGLGWQVLYVGGSYVFDVIPGVDRHATVYFDTAFDTAQAQSWLSSDSDTKTFTYVAGQGEGVARTIVQRFTGGTEPTGLTRRELFTDARDLSDSNALITRGDSILAEKAIADRYEVTVQANGSFKYRTDWDLGDLVTIRNAAWGLSKTSRIVGIDLHLSAEMTSPEVTVTLDKPFPSLATVIMSGVGGGGSGAIVDTAAPGTYAPLSGATFTGGITFNADVSAPNIVGFRAYSTAVQSFAANTFTAASFPSTIYNTGGAYNPSTNVFTAPSAGLYIASTAITVGITTQDTRYVIVSSSSRVATVIDAVTRIGNAVSVATFPIKLSAGEQIAIVVLFSAAVSTVPTADDRAVWWEMRKLG